MQNEPDREPTPEAIEKRYQSLMALKIQMDGLWDMT